MNAGLGICMSEEGQKFDRPQARRFPIAVLKSPQLCGGHPRGEKTSGDVMGVIEWVAVGVVLVAGALFVGFPIGVAVGYKWRDRISRARRARSLIEQARRHAESDAAATASARQVS